MFSAAKLPFMTDVCVVSLLDVDVVASSRCSQYPPPDTTTTVIDASSIDALLSHHATAVRNQRQQDDIVEIRLLKILIHDNTDM